MLCNRYARNDLLELGGTHGDLAHPCTDLHRRASHRRVQKSETMGIPRQTGGNDLPVPVALYQHRLAGQFVLVRAGAAVFAGGRYLSDALVRAIVPARAERLSACPYLLYYRLARGTGQSHRLVVNPGSISCDQCGTAPAANRRGLPTAGNAAGTRRGSGWSAP